MSSTTSGSPNADAPPEFECLGIPCGTFKLNFGSNFLSNKNESDYHILKFDIKPPTTRGTAHINFDANDSMKLTIPTDEPENNAIYKGTVSQVKNGKECLLLFDGENLRIEKVSSMMHAKHVRCDRGEDDEAPKPRIITPEPSSRAQPQPIIPPSDADDEVSEGEASSDDDEQLLLEQIANFTQPPSNPEPPKQQELQTPPIYNPSSQASTSSPPRTNSSTTYHSSPALSLIPTPPSKNSSLLEDLMMSDSSDSSSDSDSSSEDDDGKASSTAKPAVANIPEPMDYAMNILKPPPFESLNKSNNDINNPGAGFNLLSSDLQLSESSSDEDMD